MDALFKLDVAFDVLDAAVYRSLKNTVNGYLEFNRKQTTNGSAIFIIVQKDIGGLGLIEIDKMSVQKSLLIFSGPKFSRELFSKEQMDFFDGDEKKLLNYSIRILAKANGNYDDLFKLRKNHWNNVTTIVRNRLIKDELWLKDEPSEKMDNLDPEPWKKIPNKLWYQQALKLWHENLTVSQISNRLGIPSQTIYNNLSKWRSIYGENIVPKRK
ncbi:MAG: hypothetical protein Q8R87_10815 [Anaerolineaceae bacterium]|nr:hypothetical protein [Anaerolineaceae bacterium]